MAKTSRQRAFAGFEDDPDSSPPDRNFVPPAADNPVPPALRTSDMRLDGQTVYVVDAHSLIYQVFHALPEMTGPSGQPVAAVHGFLRDILELLDSKRPDYLFCAFDAPGGENFRTALYPDYKAHRESMPEDLRSQLPHIRRMLGALGVPALEVTNFEADDLLATIARETVERGGECVLVTADKDCRQLINDRVKVYNIRKGTFFDAAQLQGEWHVRPEQVVDFQALVGDSVDNVPGVPLIGPKIAGELLGRYGTLENVLDHAEEVSGAKRRENLRRYREQALLSRQLARLDDRVPLEIDWAAGRVGKVDATAVADLSREFGFRRLGERLAGLATGAAVPDWNVRYRTVDSLQELQSLAAEMGRQPRIAFDTETTSTNPRFAELVGCSFAWREGEAYYVPLRAPRGEPQLPLAPALEILRPILAEEKPKKVGQNTKYDVIVFRSAGIAVRGVECDTMVADYLLAPGERSHGLDDLSRRYLQHEPIPITRLIGTGRQQRRMDEVPVEQVTQYAAEDADVTWRLARILEQRLAAEGLGELFAGLEMPLIDVLAEMEFNGIKVDVGRLRELSRRFGQRMETLEAEIHELAGGPFNIDSRLQLSEVLFRRLHLPVLKRTKTGPSTDGDVLTDLAQLHPLPAKIIEYRQHAKLKSTYVDALPQLVHPVTGRIHTSFKQDVAATGRLSSTDPNLQNIPIRTPEGREIRSAFLPGESGWQLVTADYSQIELRVLAHFSGDAALQQAFAENRDVHRQVASEIYGIPAAAVTPEMRRTAKAVNFGVIYGQTPFGLAKSLGIDQEQAGRFIEAYFARYAGVEQFTQKVLEQCRQNGYVSTILGRRRAVQGVRDPSQTQNSRQRTLPERIAINTVIQGSAADLIKQAMIQVHRRLRGGSWSARLLLQIHDELVFEAPANELPSLVDLITREMESAGQLNVPLKVDVKAGGNWAECEAVS